MPYDEIDKLLANNFYERSYKMDEVTLPKYEMGSNEPLYNTGDLMNGKIPMVPLSDYQKAAEANKSKFEEKHKAPNLDTLNLFQHDFVVTSWKTQGQYKVASEYTCRHCLMVVEKGQVPEEGCI